MDRTCLKQKYFVIDPVVNLRAFPKTYLKGWEKDSAQESQLLMNEIVGVIESEGDDVKVVVYQQPKYFVEENRWGPYEGWIPRSSLLPCVERQIKPSLILHRPWEELSIGTRLDFLEEEKEYWVVCLPSQKRCKIPKDRACFIDAIPSFDLLAHAFLGSPYLWGGRSSYRDSSYLCSVDCSGLVHLLYLMRGYVIARDSKDQFRQAPSDGCKKPFQKGDLIFLSKDHSPDRIYHVLMVLNENLLVESCQAAQGVRLITPQERLGVPLKLLELGTKCLEGYVFWSHFDMLIHNKRD